MPATTDGVEVRLGADTGEATSGVASAASSIEGSLDKLNESMHGLGEKHAEAMHQMVRSNQEAKDSFLGLSEAVRVRFGSINSAFEQFRTKLAGVAEAFAALALERESVKALTGFEGDVRSLEIAFGMSADQATRLSVALKLAGSDGTQYSEMLVRLGERMRTNQSEFTRLGVVINDSNGHLLDAQTILQNVYKRMQDFKAGSDQDLFVMDLLGRGAREFSDSMSRLAETQGRANELVQKFGISMGPEEQGNIERFRIEANAFKIVVEELSVRIGEQFLPGIERMLQAVVKAGPSFLELGTQASKAFSDIAIGIVQAFSPQNADKIDFLGSTLKALSLAIAGVREFAMDLIDAISGLVSVFTHFAQGVHDAESALAHLDFSGAIAAVKRTDAQILADTRATVAKMKGEYEQWEKDRDAILFGRKPEASGPATAASRATAGLPASGTGTYTPPPPKGGGDDRLAEWKDELVQMQEAEGYFHEMSKEQEAEFWQAKLALVTGYGKEEVRLRRELTKMIFDDRKAEAQQEYQQAMATFQREIDGAKNNRDQQIKDAEARTAFVKATYGEESAAFQRAMDEETRIREEWAKKDLAIAADASKHRIEMAKLEIDSETSTLNYEVALRQISADQEFAIEQDLENKLYALDLKAMQDKLATLQQGTLAYQRQAEDIEKLEAQHQQRLTDIARQAELERRKDELQATQDFQNDFASAIEQVVNGTKSLKQAFLDFFKQLDQQLVQLASNKIAQQLFGPGTSGGGFIQGIMGKIFGGGALGGGGGAGASAEAAATQATTTAMTQLTAATTTQSTTFNLLDSGSTLLETAFQTLASAAQSAASALLSMGGGGGGLGGIGDMFGGFGSSDFGGVGGFGGMFGFPMFASGTPYVPRDMLAIIHKGEAIIPAGMNRPGGNTSSYAVHNYFNIAGGADARSQGQIAAAAFHGMQIAARRHA